MFNVNRKVTNWDVTLCRRPLSILHPAASHRMTPITFVHMGPEPAVRQLLAAVRKSRIRIERFFRSL